MRIKNNTAPVLSLDDLASMTGQRMNDLLEFVNERNYIPYDMAVELAAIYGTSVTEWR
jgi:plasmid maintenance system antidote protein VapI